MKGGGVGLELGDGPGAATRRPAGWNAKLGTAAALGIG